MDLSLLHMFQQYESKKEQWILPQLHSGHNLKYCCAVELNSVFSSAHVPSVIEDDLQKKAEIFYLKFANLHP